MRLNTKIWDSSVVHTAPLQLLSVCGEEEEEEEENEEEEDEEEEEEEEEEEQAFGSSPPTASFPQFTGTPSPFHSTQSPTIEQVGQVYHQRLSIVPLIFLCSQCRNNTLYYHQIEIAFENCTDAQQYVLAN